MKNFLILGLLAALLFSVSAALSLWLNQSRQPTETTQPGEKLAGSKSGSRNSEYREPTDSRPPPTTDPGTTPGTDATTLAVLRDREAKLERRAAQIDLILKDVQYQREALEATIRQVSAELRVVVNKSAENDAIAADLKKKVIEYDAAELKNIEKMAALYDTMAAESAALIVKQMAESGRMETAAKILARMKERNAAALLAALNDAPLAAQLLEKIRGLKVTPTPAIPKT